MPLNQHIRKGLVGFEAKTSPWRWR